MNRIATLLILVLALGLMGFIGCPYLFAPGRLVIINGGKEDLVAGEARLTKSWSKRSLPVMHPGESVSFRFRPLGDDDYRMNWTWRSGRTGDTSFGYVTVGLTSVDTVTITSEGLKLAGGDAKP